MERQVATISEIVIGKRFRRYNKAAMEAIRDSLDDPQRDLVNPIALYELDGKLHLCAGLHRLKAFEAKGETVIPYELRPAGEDIDYEIAQLRENLARVELSQKERERHTSELLKRIEKRSKAECGKLGGLSSRRAGDTVSVAKSADFCEALKELEEAAVPPAKQCGETVQEAVVKLAKASGKSERQVWRDKKRGDVLSSLEEAGAPIEEAAEALEDNCTRKAVVEVAEADTPKAIEIVQRLAAGDDTACIEVKAAAKAVKEKKQAAKKFEPCTEAELKRRDKLNECSNTLRLMREDMPLVSDELLSEVHSRILELYAFIRRSRKCPEAATVH